MWRLSSAAASSLCAPPTPMGGQHPSFQGLGASTRNLGEVSRPEALGYAGQDVPVQDAATQAPKSPVQVAAAEQPAKAASASTEKV